MLRVSELLGCLTCVLFKEAEEVRIVVIAYFCGNLCNGEVGVHKQAALLQQYPFLYKLHSGIAQGALTGMVELLCRYMEPIRIKAHRQVRRK